jgi:hypothetical protein
MMDQQMHSSMRDNQSFWLGFGASIVIAVLIVGLAALALGPTNAAFVLAAGLALALGYGVR